VTVDVTAAAFITGTAIALTIGAVTTAAVVTAAAPTTETAVAKTSSDNFMIASPFDTFLFKENHQMVHDINFETYVDFL